MDKRKESFAVGPVTVGSLVFPPEDRRQTDHLASSLPVLTNTRLWLHLDKSLQHQKGGGLVAT